jgi:sterol desaturase/sphingolipid hydroxylase (fatty acid hydroxylase superfamily)
LLLIKTISVAVLLLLIGDFVATFFYHVPEHVFGKYHNIVHHSLNRSFVRYAIKNKRPQALIIGFLAVVPYLLPLPWLWQISPSGVILGLILAQLHVIWRHSTVKTPVVIAQFCNLIQITTPERHNLHHEDMMSAYGDVFAFFDRPAQSWLQFLSNFSKQVTE